MPLAFSLSLTLFIVATTIIPVTNMRRKGILDAVWALYWQIIGAETGVFMAAAITFRSLFMASSNRRNARIRENVRSRKATFGCPSRRRFGRRDVGDRDNGLASEEAESTEIPNSHQIRACSQPERESTIVMWKDLPKVKDYRITI